MCSIWQNLETGPITLLSLVCSLVLPCPHSKNSPNALPILLSFARPMPLYPFSTGSGSSRSVCFSPGMACYMACLQNFQAVVRDSWLPNKILGLELLQKAIDISHAYFTEGCISSLNVQIILLTLRHYSGQVTIYCFAFHRNIFHCCKTEKFLISMMK